ncbi:hypothetical protein FQA39_LY12845 [Lamprigera yunnana]|nr:hypothetical protein FQA39_LY12845 [Lamprigera yunnana]
MEKDFIKQIEEFNKEKYIAVIKNNFKLPNEQLHLLYEDFLKINSFEIKEYGYQEQMTNFTNSTFYNTLMVGKQLIDKSYYDEYKLNLEIFNHKFTKIINNCFLELANSENKEYPMQVITGKYKGMKLNSLEGMNTRPTSARIKQNMFNILDNYFIFENKTSLDIFGGSGALTIEAISRGIDKAIINDHYSDAIKVIKSNLDRLKEDNYEILQYDYEQLLEVMKNRDAKFEFDFLRSTI